MDSTKEESDPTENTKEKCDKAENALRNSENKDSNACNTEKELSPADVSMNSQIDNSLSIRDPSSSGSQEDMDPQTTENNEQEIENTQNDPQNEELKKDCFPSLISIPRKLIMVPKLRLFRIIYLSIPELQIHENKSLPDKTIFYPGKVEMKISEYCHNTIYDKMLYRRLHQSKVPFFNNDEINRMIIHLLCRRHFSHPAGPQNSMRARQKYAAVLCRSNALTNDERIVFGRPLRVYYYHPLIERVTLGNFYKSNQKKDGNYTYVRPMFYMPQLPIQNVVHKKTSEKHLKIRHKLKLMIVTSNKSWNYFCVICGCAFNNFNDFKKHSYSCSEK